jgi:hypothetical protein
MSGKGIKPVLWAFCTWLSSFCPHITDAVPGDWIRIPNG